MNKYNAHTPQLTEDSGSMTIFINLLVTKTG